MPIGYNEQTLSEAQSVFDGLRKEQFEKTASENPCEIFREMVRDIVHSQSGETIHEKGNFMSTVGKRENGVYYFIPSKIYGEAVKLYNVNGNRFPCDQRQLQRMLKEAGHLITGKDVTKPYTMRHKDLGNVWAISEKWIEDGDE